MEKLYDGWVGLGYLRILRRRNNISVISRLGGWRYPISEIQISEILVARPGIKPRTSFSTSQGLNHSTTAALEIRILVLI